MERRFYARRGLRSAWVDAGRFNSRYDALLRALEKAPAHGLDAESYHLAALKALRPRALGTSLVGPAERQLDSTLLRYARDLLQGRLDPQEIHPGWDAARRARDLAPLLERAIERNQIEAALEALAPAQRGYKALVAALARYRAIADKGGWPQLQAPPPGRSIAGADRELLARRLDAEDDLGFTNWRLLGTDADLLAALRRFQRRHGLRDHGALDDRTLLALNAPAAERVRQIELNLERWRWLPDDFGARYILVNIPDFTLQAIEGGGVRMAMRAVVGKQAEPTPILSDQMTQVVFSPFWNVPERIAREEVLPALRKDPSYLESQNIQLLRVGAQAPRALDLERGSMQGLAFRQRPGSGNVMGDVKFAFPNRFDVYLHDTPDAASFYAAQPAFSHGCIRVERPAALAQYVLGHSSYWTGERIRAAMSSGRERAVPLAVPLPVHIVYWTAWVEEDGAVNFRDDVYGYDKAQQRLLDEETRAPRRLRPSPETPPGVAPSLVRSSRNLAPSKLVAGPL